jgi:D-serine deaminase-like pyridoxal phosphate-dependent protein
VQAPKVVGSGPLRVTATGFGVPRCRKLRAAGTPCPEVSVGSTPTVLSATNLDGVTEVRAGVYAVFDLVMVNVGFAPRRMLRCRR